MMSNNTKSAIDNLQIISTTDILEFILLLKELEFADKFSLAMLKWCGIGKWDKSIKFWEVYLAKLNTDSIGIMGLYQYIKAVNHLICSFRLQGCRGAEERV
jgi:hypothetical protein